MLKLFRKINDIFIQIVLILFYFSVIGVAKILHIFSKKREIFPNTYWEKPSSKPLDITSSY